jgi:hypothetical protein
VSKLGDITLRQHRAVSPPIDNRCQNSPTKPLDWLRLRLHDATGCRYAHWEALLAGGPADPPPPAST